MIDDHKTKTIAYAYKRFIEFQKDLHRRLLGSIEISDDDRKAYDSMWSRIMTNGAERFFLEETATPDSEIDFETVNFFIWIYERDGWTTLRPYWHALRVTWRNYRAMGLDMCFERTEDYRVRKQK